MFNILSLLLGVGSWFIPIYSWLKNSYSLNKIILSLSLAILSLFTVFLSIFRRIDYEDWSALLDIYSTLRVCVILLISGVFVFNVLLWFRIKKQ